MRPVAPRAIRVPVVITAVFWVVKTLTTAMGEATSDWMVKVLNPVVAVVIGFVVFVAALALQFRMRRYMAWTYWLAVAMVAVFGTQAADVLHKRFGVPYVASSLFYAAVLVVIFFTWARVEGTLSIHSIDTARRESFYWAAVLATFALGTAVGDLTAFTLHLGYLSSGFLFAGAIAVPALAYWQSWMPEVGAFWFAYVLTRPVGASFADWFGKDHRLGGLGLGDGAVVLALTAVIVGLVAYLAVTRIDQPSRPLPARSDRRA